MLYDLVRCEHRPAMDLFGDPKKRDRISPFVRLLWEKGTAYENEVIEDLERPILDLSSYHGDEKEQKTCDAIEHGESLIYSARISADDLLGEPDLLRREGNGYVAGDIKSGSGEEGQDDDATLKKHYGVQLALYTDILERKGVASSRRPFVWDIYEEQVTYDLEAPQGKRNPTTLWAIYQEALAKAQLIVGKKEKTRPAYSSPCKLCHWYSACIDELESADDLTLLPELGRIKRDVMVDRFGTTAKFAAIDVDDLIAGRKTVFPGIGADTLRKLHARAQLNTTVGAEPYLTDPVDLPDTETELFFDIEVDPMRDFCYLHGFVERRGGDNKSECYTAFFADTVTEKGEKQVFTDAWQYIGARQPCAIYYYSKYERTIWRQLQVKYPDVCSVDDIEDLFDPNHAVDLYFDVVKKITEWPTRDYSIKTLARFLGFKWRDTDPSGAASIEWFDQWVRTQDPKIKQRILEYNEDDCVATRVLLDGIRLLKPAQVAGASPIA